MGNSGGCQLFSAVLPGHSPRPGACQPHKSAGEPAYLRWQAFLSSRLLILWPPLTFLITVVEKSAQDAGPRANRSAGAG